MLINCSIYKLLSFTVFLRSRCLVLAFLYHLRIHCLFYLQDNFLQLPDLKNLYCSLSPPCVFLLENPSCYVNVYNLRCLRFFRRSVCSVVRSPNPDELRDETFIPLSFNCLPYLDLKIAWALPCVSFLTNASLSIYINMSLPVCSNFLSPSSTAIVSA